MATKTEHLQLTKPDPSEYYDIEVFNTNADKIDKAISDNSLRIDAQGKLIDDFDYHYRAGDIIDTIRNDLSRNWVLCNGEEFQQKDYPELADAYSPIQALNGGFDKHFAILGTSTASQNRSIIYGMDYHDGIYGFCGWLNGSDNDTYNDSQARAAIAYTTDLKTFKSKTVWTSSDNAFSATAYNIRYLNGEWIICGTNQSVADSQYTSMAIIYHGKSLDGALSEIEYKKTSGSKPSAEYAVYDVLFIEGQYIILYREGTDDIKADIRASLTSGTVRTMTIEKEGVWSTGTSVPPRRLYYGNGVIFFSVYDAVYYINGISDWGNLKKLDSGIRKARYIKYLNDYYYVCGASERNDGSSRIARAKSPDGTFEMVMDSTTGSFEETCVNIFYMNGYYLALIDDNYDGSKDTSECQLVYTTDFKKWTKLVTFQSATYDTRSYESMIDPQSDKKLIVTVRSGSSYSEGGVVVNKLVLPKAPKDNGSAYRYVKINNNGGTA